MSSTVEHLVQFHEYIWKVWHCASVASHQYKINYQCDQLKQHIASNSGRTAIFQWGQLNLPRKYIKYAWIVYMGPEYIEGSGPAAWLTSVGTAAAPPLAWPAGLGLTRDNWIAERHVQYSIQYNIHQRPCFKCVCTYDREQRWTWDVFVVYKLLTILIICD